MDLEVPGSRPGGGTIQAIEKFEFVGGGCISRGVNTFADLPLSYQQKHFRHVDLSVKFFHDGAAGVVMRC